MPAPTLSCEGLPATFDCCEMACCEVDCCEVDCCEVGYCEVGWCEGLAAIDNCCGRLTRINHPTVMNGHD